MICCCGALRGRLPRLVVTAAIVVFGAASLASAQPASVPDADVKAAFLYNFAKFIEWPALTPEAPITACIVGDDRVAAALAGMVSGRTVGGHAIAVSRPQDDTTWRTCQLLFIAESGTRRPAADLGGVVALPVLTVSDGKGFSKAGGLIELYVESDRMRFAINVDAVKRSGLRLSSRLLGLAKIVRNGNVQ